MSQDVNGRLRAWMLAAMGCALEPRSAVYVSTPITTGPRYVAWRRGPAVALAAGTSEHRDRLLEEVVAPNRAAVAPFVRELRKQLDEPVIDPTALEDVPGWEQFDYHRFWAEVVQQFAKSVVFVDGWEYSSGCILEFVAAVDAGVTLVGQDLVELSVDDAVASVEAALNDVAADDVLPQGPLSRALDALRARQRTRSGFREPTSG